MRIEGTPPLRRSARRDDRGAAASDGAFSSEFAEAPPPPAAARAAPGLAGLLALQEVSDSLTGRRRAVARGTELLDRLDELRLALLAGALPRGELDGLARLARESMPLIDDPQLAEILGQIELRAEVELAKLEFA